MRGHKISFLLIRHKNAVLFISLFEPLWRRAEADPRVIGLVWTTGDTHQQQRTHKPPPPPPQLPGTSEYIDHLHLLDQQRRRLDQQERNHQLLTVSWTHLVADGLNKTPGDNAIEGSLKCAKVEAHTRPTRAIPRRKRPQTTCRLLFFESKRSTDRPETDCHPASLSCVANSVLT